MLKRVPSEQRRGLDNEVEANSVPEPITPTEKPAKRELQAWKTLVGAYVKTFLRLDVCAHRIM